MTNIGELQLDASIAEAIETYAVPGFRSSKAEKRPSGIDEDVADAIRAEGLTGFRSGKAERPSRIDEEISDCIETFSVPGFKARAAKLVAPKPVAPKPVATMPVSPKPVSPKPVAAKRYDIRLDRRVGEVTADGAFMFASRDPVGDICRRLQAAGVNGPISLRIVRPDLSNIVETITPGDAEAIARIRAEIRSKESV